VGEELNRLIDALAAGSQSVCWEGQTLVVDTTNFSPNSYFMGSAKNVLKKHRSWSQSNAPPSWVAPVCPINPCGEKSRPARL
jgi:hypothetical protein